MAKKWVQSFMLAGFFIMSPANAAYAPLASAPAGLGTLFWPTDKISAMEAVAETGPTVPFIVQAPLGDWQDPRLMDGCEEAVITMAYYWAKDKILTPEIGLKEITGLSDHEVRLDGEFRDRSVLDTAILMAGYFDFDNVRTAENASISDIIDELAAGNAVILPIAGQKIGNPHYRAPGPPNHMVLAIAYDAETEEFIVHDPGTVHGKAYRYPLVAIDRSWRDYPTGYHDVYPEIRRNMAVVSR